VSEPAQRRSNDDGSKWYEHPSRTEDVREGGGDMVTVRPARYVSVTTALGVVNKQALMFWSANLAARRAMENLPKLIGAARRDDCGRARARVEPLGCKECAACAEHWVASFHIGEKERRAREGSAAHDVLEAWILTGEWTYTPRADWGEYAPTPDEMAPYLASLKAFITDYALTRESFLIAECTVWNHTWRYAGTLDAIVVIKPVTKAAAEFCAKINHSIGQPLDAPVTVLVDLKSREGEGAGIYVDQPLQLAAYRWAETMTPKFGAAEMEAEMIQTDGAAILQVRPDGYTFRPVVTDGATFKAFRDTLGLHGWHSTIGEFATQVKAFPKPDGWTWVPPKPVLAPSAKLNVTDPADKPKAAPRKRAAKKAPGAPAATAGTSATMASMVDRQQVAGAEVRDDQIPF
jgi:hypothetical protein